MPSVDANLGETIMVFWQPGITRGSERPTLVQTRHQVGIVVDTKEERAARRRSLTLATAGIMTKRNDIKTICH